MITDVIERSGLYCIYNGNNQSGVIPIQLGELLGIGLNFILLDDGILYKTFDYNGNMVNTLPKQIGEFKNVAGNNFNLILNNMVSMYNSNCQKIKTTFI